MLAQEKVGKEAVLDIRPVAGRIGAEIVGIKVGGQLDAATVAALRSAWLKYKVLFFRGQHHMTLADQEAFGRLFGTLVPHPTIPKIAGTEVALAISYDDGKHAANEWHTDESFMDNYHMAGILHAITLPSIGGDTMWANTATAYQELPEPLRDLADKLWAFHTNMSAYNASKRHPNSTTIIYEAEQPVVQVHPETGERTLMLGFHAQSLVGLNRQDSARLMNIYQDHISRPENVVRWRWQLGDVTFWDNRATQHYGIGDFTEKRALNRISLEGSVGVGVDGRRAVQCRKEEWKR